MILRTSRHKEGVNRSAAADGVNFPPSWQLSHTTSSYTGSAVGELAADVQAAKPRFSSRPACLAPCVRQGRRGNSGATGRGPS